MVLTQPKRRKKKKYQRDHRSRFRSRSGHRARRRQQPEAQRRRRLRRRHQEKRRRLLNFLKGLVVVVVCALLIIYRAAAITSLGYEIDAGRQRLQQMHSENARLAITLSDRGSARRIAAVAEQRLDLQQQVDMRSVRSQAVATSAPEHSDTLVLSPHSGEPLAEQPPDHLIGRIADGFIQWLAGTKSVEAAVGR